MAPQTESPNASKRPGSKDPTPCAPGTFSADPTEKCTNCTQGRYAPLQGAADCAACKEGKFQDEPGRWSSCTTAPTSRNASVVLVACGRFRSSVVALFLFFFFCAGAEIACAVGTVYLPGPHALAWPVPPLPP